MESFTILSEEKWYNIQEEREANFRRLIGERRKGRFANTGFFVNDANEIRLIGTFLNQDINGFYHSDYNSGGAWEIQHTIENMIWTLKNDVDQFPQRLPNAQQQLSVIIRQDLPQISQQVRKNNLTVCVVPRSKAEGYYRADQLLFRRVISVVVDQMQNFENGTNYIVRHTNTRTTHLNKSGYGGDGDLPYPGITKNTCNVSGNVRGKDILLIDDLYTETVNIDEDAIQALLDNGATNVFFYSVGKTFRGGGVPNVKRQINDDEDDLPF